MRSVGAAELEAAIPVLGGLGHTLWPVLLPMLPLCDTPSVESADGGAST